jgi:hypothetical protein
MLKYSIKMDIKEILCEVTDWIHVALDRDQLRALVNLPSSVACWEFNEWLSNYWLQS